MYQKNGNIFRFWIKQEMYLFFNFFFSVGLHDFDHEAYSNRFLVWNGLSKKCIQAMIIFWIFKQFTK